MLPPPAWRLVASVRMANTCSNHPTDTAGVSSVADQLVIRGAREHNLKDVSLDLPRDSLIVFTGLSGSGKSSLAFDTIFAEGQRRYVESLSAYARQFLGPDGQARRRLHRGPEPGGLHRPEVHVEEPALDRRHDHRGLRLPPAALRPCRPAALPRVRRADRATDPAADRRPRPAARGGHPLPGARAGHPRPQGGVRRAVPQPAVAGVQPGPRQRRDHPARPSRPSWTSRRSTPSRSSSTGWRPSRASKRRLTDSIETALNLASGLVVLDLVDLDAKDPHKRDAVLRADGLPQRARHRDRRARAPLVLVQLAVRRLP